MNANKFTIDLIYVHNAQLHEEISLTVNEQLEKGIMSLFGFSEEEKIIYQDTKDRSDNRACFG